MLLPLLYLQIPLLVLQELLALLLVLLPLLLLVLVEWEESSLEPPLQVQPWVLAAVPLLVVRALASSPTVGVRLVPCPRQKMPSGVVSQACSLAGGVLSPPLPLVTASVPAAVVVAAGQGCGWAGGLRVEGEVADAPSVLWAVRAVRAVGVSASAVAAAVAAAHVVRMQALQVPLWMVPIWEVPAWWAEGACPVVLASVSVTRKRCM